MQLSPVSRYVCPISHYAQLDLNEDWSIDKDNIIQHIISHPKYKPPSKYHDIALLELASDVQFEDAIRPACLWTRPDFGENNKAVATGWGVVDTLTKETSKDLQKVSLSLLDNTFCDPLLEWSWNRNWKGFVPEQMCAGELRGGRDTCQYLYGREIPFVLRTDHKPLLSIFGLQKGIPEVTTNRLQRYAIFLAAYNYKITYVPSSANIADYLSRSMSNVSDSASAGLEEARECEDRASYINFVVEGDLPVTLTQIREATIGDATLQKVKGYILTGWPRKVTDLNITPYFLCRSQLSIEKGCLMRGHKVVIPGNLRDQVIQELHSSHFGIAKMKSEARSRLCCSRASTRRWRRRRARATFAHSCDRRPPAPPSRPGHTRRIPFTGYI
ncbi:hypothetical protein evm_010308 [Chilo suppressalis]|nr:hypothetical protein evm_010308 [Chilo suppressalis]